MNSIGMYKNPWCNQYVAPYGYAFYDTKGNCLGKIIWRKKSEVNGIYIDKDLLF